MVTENKEMGNNNAINYCSWHFLYNWKPLLLINDFVYIPPQNFNNANKLNVNH